MKRLRRWWQWIVRAWVADEEMSARLSRVDDELRRKGQ